LKTALKFLKNKEEAAAAAAPHHDFCLSYSIAAVYKLISFLNIKQASYLCKY
jgi:hypothetical protein